MHNTRFVKTLIAAAAILSAGWASAQSKLGATYEEILAGAKQEGKITAWIAAPRAPEAHQALIAAFNKRFGLNTQLEWVPNSAVTSNTRAIAESASGKVGVDLIGAGAISEVKGALDAKLIKPYPWGQVFGKALPQLAALQALELPEFKNVALPYQQVAYGLAWNPGMVKEADLPTKFSDLADPKWKGKVGLNAFFMTPVDVLGFSAGNAATLELAKKLLANGPVFDKGTPAVARSVSTGVVPMGVIVNPVAEFAKRKGEPLNFKLFTDYVPVSMVYLYVPENSPNPNTARLFAAWLSVEGAAVANPIEPYDSPVDANAPINKMIAAATAAGAKLSKPTSSATLVENEVLRKELSLMLSGQGK
jgi:ABC-type Fe3+ transport system substrate-binding protein